MTPFPQRWTVLSILRWVLVCWGTCCFAAGVWIANSQFAEARDAVIWVMAPLLALTNWSRDIYIHTDPLHEEFFVSTALGSGFQLKPRWVGWGMIAAGLAMTLTTSIFIGRARRNRSLQLTQLKLSSIVRSGVENPAS